VFEDIELKNQHSKIPKIKFRETNKSVLKKLDEQNDTYEIVFAAYLKRIGSDVENHKNKTLEYLYEMKEELESIDNIFNHIYDVKILELSKDTDEELDAILSN
jgi:ABC-type transporter lipoprotein component MlaA